MSVYKIIHQKFFCDKCGNCVKKLPIYWEMGNDDRPHLKGSEEVSEEFFVLEIRDIDDENILQQVVLECNGNGIHLIKDGINYETSI